MVQLTVAIPTLRRWGFLQKTLPSLLDNDLITWVVISDETGEDIKQIQATEYATNSKLILSTNTEILGMYRNKRRCLELAPTEWVAVLDSDNVFPEAFFETIMDELQTADQKTIYASANIVRLFLKTGESEERTQHFSGKKINQSNWNETLQTRAWNFLLNDGNCIWPRDVVKHFPDIPEDQMVGTDSIFFMRQAIQAGYTLSVEPTMRYVHTVHDGSHWLQNAQVSSRLMGMRDWRV